GGDLFAATNWLAVFMGQDVWPARYDPLVDQYDVDAIRRNLRDMAAAIRATANMTPLHADYIEHYCRAPQEGRR
ncbi:MAG TPA: hypothetical protein VII41_04365, partial [Steroidobacteraceae bacterium]